MIRPMRRDDKTAVLDLIRDTGMFTAAEVGVAEELIDVYLDVPGQKDYRVAVAVAGGEAEAIAGYMTWGPTPLAESAYDLYWMAVSRKEQGKGLGKAMVRWLEEEVRKAEGRMIVIETSSQPRYEPTRRFYLHLDYKEVARVPDFYKPGDDRVIYAKYFR
jgi:ribosomal protein S18 acetylase RimI-like enzyme